MLKIEKNVPFPESTGKGRRSGDRLYPFGEMEVGDSFVTEKNGHQIVVLANRRYGPKKKFSARSIFDAHDRRQFRVWRVK